MRDYVPVCLGFCLASSFASAEQHVYLRPDFIPATEAYYRHRFRFRQIMRRHELLGGRMTTIDTMTGYHLRVLDGQDENHHPLELTFVALMHRFGRPIDVAYDSRVEENQDEAQRQVVSALLNKPFRVVVRDDGSVASVEGLDGFLNREFEGSDRLKVVVEYYRKLVSPNTLERLLLYNLLKDAPLASLVGETWTTRREWSQQGGRLACDLTITLDQVKLEEWKPLGFVSIRGRIALASGPASQPERGPQIKAASGEETGTIQYNIVKRAYENVEVSQRVKLDLSWRVGEKKTEMTRLAEQITRMSLERTTRADLLAPPEPPERRAPTTQPTAAQPAATQPAGTDP